MQQTLWQNVFIQTIMLNLKAKAFWNLHATDSATMKYVPCNIFD